MRAVRNTGSGVGIVEVPEPDAGDARLRVKAASICGSDLNLASQGTMAYTYGHEFAGEVDGQRYAVEPAICCGSCEQCLAGHPVRCTSANRANLGFDADGGLADWVVVPNYTLIPLSPSLDVRDACLIEPAAVAWHGVRVAQPRDGERLLVVGGGSIGLLVAAAARHMGFEVDLEARHRHQIEAGERLGAGRPSGTYDLVFDAAGSTSGLQRCADQVRIGGRLVLLSFYQDLVPFPGFAFMTKELTVRAAMAYGSHEGTRDCDDVAAMLAANSEIASTLITHRFPLDDAEEAFRVAGDRSAGAIKVVLEP
jgi:2-desacetyl-2-hydroxyethyl bacteriochlorophyllide A dehydrogenase